MFDKLKFIIKKVLGKVRGFFDHVRWCLKQVLPLTYRSHYIEEDGKKYFEVWRMWFGKCFDRERVEKK